MSRYDAQLVKTERKLLNDLSGMKFSFKKLVKVIELDALLNYNK